MASKFADDSNNNACAQTIMESFGNVLEAGERIVFTVKLNERLQQSLHHAAMYKKTREQLEQHKKKGIIVEIHCKLENAWSA